MCHPRTVVSVALAVLSGIVAVSSATPSSILEKKLPVPPSIQWKTVDAEISLIALAWGPANSSEMISKGRDKYPSEKPDFFADRSHVLALGFQVIAPGRAALQGSTCSGLVRVKNVDGDLENPSVLTPSGFLPLPTVGCGSFDVDFGGSNPTKYWDFFPASPSQREFLFEVFPPTGALGLKGNPALSFRIIVKDNEFVIVNTLPAIEDEHLNFTKTFAGTVGPNSTVNLQLTRKGATLSGTNQYARIGRTLWLKGRVDSLGNFVLEEQHPKNRATGIFKGKFSGDYRTMAGYFSKPDGSRLQPFEFHEAEASK